MIQLKDERGPGPPTEAELLPMVRSHWQTHRPLAFKRLQQSNYLDEAIQTAAQLTLTAMAQLTGRRQMDPWEAWLLVREEWALLPAEEAPEMAQEPPPFLLETEAPEETGAVVSAAGSPERAGFAWPACWAKCLRILGRLIGRK